MILEKSLKYLFTDVDFDGVLVRVVESGGGAEAHTIRPANHCVAE